MNVLVQTASPLPPPPPPSPLWEKVKAWFSSVGFRIVGPILVVLVVIVGVMLASMGYKELQLGGLISKLLGKKTDSDSNESPTIELANSVDPDRVGPDGKLIAPGQADSTGQTQAIVVPIKEPGLFSDPKKVVFTPPGSDKPMEVTLPDGVTNKDVDQVVVVKPDVVAVTVKDSSGVPAKRVDDLLEKYGS